MPPTRLRGQFGFYGDIPDRIGDAVTNLKMLPERMDPTCSECN